jgi:anaerobic nitric oxide reductase flavorubredoxin
MKKTVKNNVYWVGKSDWELRQFHGYEYSTNNGSTYNSYLICEGKTVLIDTVFKPFSGEFIENLSEEIELSKIDYIICNHAEPDHSGALPDLMELIPGTLIYCTKNCIKSLQGHYHKNWNFKIVETGDRLPLGNGRELIFIQAPMLHWPDSMFCYLTEDNILFSNDAFGQHFCTEPIFNDLVDQYELNAEAIKYYANILAPFSKLVTKKIEEILSLNLPVDMICPSHGIIWRDDPLQIVRKYAEWADHYQQNQVTVIYDTMYNGTRAMAESIADGLTLVDKELTVKLYNASKNDKNDIITEIFKSRAILVGCPTVNNGIMYSIAGLMEMLKGLKFQGKKAAAFGCYGWHDTSTKIIGDLLKESGFEIVSEPLSTIWEPDHTLLARCVEYGKQFTTALN